MDGSKDLISGIIRDLDTLYVLGGSLLVRLIDRRGVLLVRPGVRQRMIRCDTNIEGPGLTSKN